MLHCSYNAQAQRKSFVLNMSENKIPETPSIFFYFGYSGRDSLKYSNKQKCLIKILMSLIVNIWFDRFYSSTDPELCLFLVISGIVLQASVRVCFYCTDSMFGIITMYKNEGVVSNMLSRSYCMLDQILMVFFCVQYCINFDKISITTE